MELFPVFEDTEIPVVEDLPLATEVAWDFENGQPLFKNGEPVYVTGGEAVKVWAWLAIQTVRAQHPVFSWDFGSDILTLIGENFREETKTAEVARYIREAVLLNLYITEVTVQDVAFKQDDLSAFVTIQTIYGEVKLVV